MDPVWCAGTEENDKPTLEGPRPWCPCHPPEWIGTGLARCSDELRPNEDEEAEDEEAEADVPPETDDGVDAAAVAPVPPLTDVDEEAEGEDKALSDIGVGVGSSGDVACGSRNIGEAVEDLMSGEREAPLLPPPEFADPPVLLTLRDLDESSLRNPTAAGVSSGCSVGTEPALRLRACCCCCCSAFAADEAGDPTADAAYAYTPALKACCCCSPRLPL